MRRKTFLLALAAVSAAMLALPALVSAQSWHLDNTTSFSVTGSGGNLTSTEGASISCTSTTGSGAFSTTTSGSVSLVLHGCTGPFGFACTSAGQSSGTVTLVTSFDGIMVTSSASEKKAGVLFTPTTSVEPTPGLKQFTEFNCLGISIKLFGKGLIGTVISPDCGVASTTVSVGFESSESGHQKDRTYTGNTYDLQTNISATSHPTASLDATVTLHTPASRTRNCT